MNYETTLHWMFSKLPMYQRQGSMAFKKDLTNTLALAKHLKDPQLQFKSIHVAGTNGKGSTSHMIASVLQEAGYKVGLYTSPHLKDFRERIKVNGKMLRKNCVINFVKRNQSFLEQQGLSFFEMTVGLAFEHFAKQEVDIAVIEVGLGGRLDSTNIINPEVSVITNIGYDHTQMLGETLTEIAFEKAGIIKENVPVVVGERQEKEVLPVFKLQAAKRKAPLTIAEDRVTTIYHTDLQGSYQYKNVKTVVEAITILKGKGFKILNKNVQNGLLHVVKNTGLLGRWQYLSKQPIVVCDTAHNKEGLEYVLEQLQNESYKKLHIVLGVVADKNLETILPMFPTDAQYYFCRPNIPRGLAAAILQENAAKFNLKGIIYVSVAHALKEARRKASKEDVIFVGGSTFVVAEVV